MKISDLIERLQELHDQHGDIDVLGAYQPNYPLVAKVLGACVVDDDDEPPVAWIALGNHPYGRSPYAPNAVFEEVGS